MSTYDTKTTFGTADFERVWNGKDDLFSKQRRLWRDITAIKNSLADLMLVTATSEQKVSREPGLIRLPGQKKFEPLVSAGKVAWATVAKVCVRGVRPTQQTHAFLKKAAKKYPKK